MLGIEKLRDALYGDVLSNEAKEPTDKLQERKLWGKTFLAGGGLLVLMLLIFYAALESRVSGLKSEMQDKLTVAEAMSGRLSALEAKVVKLESMPMWAQKLMFKNYVGEVSQKVGMLSSQAMSDEQKAALAKIQEQLAILAKEPLN